MPVSSAAIRVNRSAPPSHLSLADPVPGRPDGSGSPELPGWAGNKPPPAAKELRSCPVPLEFFRLSPNLRFCACYCANRRSRGYTVGNVLLKGDGFGGGNGTGFRVSLQLLRHVFLGPSQPEYGKWPYSSPSAKPIRPQLSPRSRTRNHNSNHRNSNKGWK